MLMLLYWFLFIESSVQSLEELAINSPPALPSLRVTDVQERKNMKLRRKYGGRGDKLHLGGFIEYDRMGVSNNTWNFMMVNYLSFLARLISVRVH